MDDLEINPHDKIVLRKLGTLCHNRRCTTRDLGDAMDACTRRAKLWLKSLVDDGFVEKTGRTYFPTEEGWKVIEGVHEEPTD